VQEATARIILGPALAYGGQPEQGIAELRAARELAERLSEPSLALRAYLNLSDSLELLGRHEEAADEAGRGLELAAQVGLTRHVYGLYLVANRAESLVALGHWREADRLLTDTLESGLTEAPVWAMLTMRHGVLAALAGRHDDAARALKECERLPPDTAAQWEMPLALAQSIVAFGRGDVERARAYVRDGMNTSADKSLSERYRWPLIWFGLRIEAESPVADGGRVESLRTCADELAAAQPQSRAYQALAAAELARATGTAPDWSPAIEAARLGREVYLLAYALLRAAQHAWSAGNRDASGPMLEEAARLATQMGAEPFLKEAQVLARRARVTIAERVSEPVAERAAQPNIEALGLTDRELEVLQLVAAGRSNPQIAAELFISPKTASVHVSNIISKLGVSSRGEAAALSHRLGLDTAAARAR
jgi:ATP/maltotriose-dependent transcriptional regulator MalT